MQNSRARLYKKKKKEIQQCQAAGSRRLNLNGRGFAGHSKLVVLFWNSLGMHVKCLCDAACAAAVPLINYNMRKDAQDPAREMRRVIALKPPRLIEVVSVFLLWLRDVCDSRSWSPGGLKHSRSSLSDAVFINTTHRHKYPS